MTDPFDAFVRDIDLESEDAFQRILLRADTESTAHDLSAALISSSFQVLSDAPLDRTPLEVRFPKLNASHRVVAATLYMRLFRNPKKPSEPRVFDPRIDGKNFDGGVVYTAEHRFTKIGDKQKPFQHMLAHALMQFGSIDLCRRSNGTSSIDPAYVYDAFSAAHGGVMVRLSRALFPYDDPIEFASKSFDLTSAASSSSAASSNKPRKMRKRAVSAGFDMESEEDDSTTFRDENARDQFMTNSETYCSFLSAADKSFLTIEGSEFAAPSTGRRIGTSVVGICMYELNVGAFLPSKSEPADSAECSTIPAIPIAMSYMHISIVLADRFTKGSGVLAFVLCLRLARKLKLRVVLEAVDRTRLSGEFRDDLVGMYSEKFGFSKMSEEQIKILNGSAGDAGIVFMMLDTQTPSTSTISDYETYLLSLMSKENLSSLEDADLNMIVKPLVGHDKEDLRTISIKRDEVSRLHDASKGAKFNTPNEFFKSCRIFATKKPTVAAKAPLDGGSRSTSPFLSIKIPASSEIEYEQNLPTFASQLRNLENRRKLTDSVVSHEAELMKLRAEVASLKQEIGSDKKEIEALKKETIDKNTEVVALKQLLSECDKRKRNVTDESDSEIECVGYFIGGKGVASTCVKR